MRVELLHSKESSLADTLKERTERVLIDVAPYAHIATVTATKARVKGTVESRSRLIPPVLQVDGIPIAFSTEGKSLSPVPEGSSAVDRELSMIPSEEEIRAVLTAAALRAGPASIRLPLQHRRFIMAGALLILIGAVLGQLLIWGSVVTLLGIALLPVGFASNGRRLRPQPLMITAGVCSLVWVSLTLWYWAPLLSGSMEPVVGPPQAIAWLGAVFFGTAWSVVLRAVFIRRALRRDLWTYLLAAVEGSASDVQ